MSLPKIYGYLISPPVRSCLMIAKVINLEVQHVNVDIFKGEHLTPEFLKMNPNHSIPVLDDNGFYLTDSHAICPYLIGKYGKDDDKLYPRDVTTRALIDRLLHFDSSTLFQTVRNIVFPILFQGKAEIKEYKINLMKEHYTVLEQFLQADGWCVGKTETLADISLAPVIMSVVPFVPIDDHKHKKIAIWLKNCSELSYFKEVNKPGLDLFISIVEKVLKKGNSGSKI